MSAQPQVARRRRRGWVMPTEIPPSVFSREVPITVRRSGCASRRSSSASAPPVQRTASQPSVARRPATADTVSGRPGSTTPAGRSSAPRLDASTRTLPDRPALVGWTSPARQPGDEAASAPASRRSSASRVRSSASDRQTPSSGGPQAHDRLTTGIPAAARRSTDPSGGLVQGATTAATRLGSAASSSSNSAAASTPRPTFCGWIVSGRPVPSAANRRPASAGPVTSSASPEDPSNRNAIRGPSFALGADEHAPRARVTSRTAKAGASCRAGTLDAPGRDGGIGRRAGLKNPWASAREGSIPSPGTDLTEPRRRRPARPRGPRTPSPRS